MMIRPWWSLIRLIRRWWAVNGRITWLIRLRLRRITWEKHSSVRTEKNFSIIYLDSEDIPFAVDTAEMLEEYFVAAAVVDQLVER